MNVIRGVASLTRDTALGLKDAAKEVHRGNVETTVGLLKGELTIVDAIKKKAGHDVAACASLVSPSKFISFVTEFTDSRLVAPLADFKEVLYDRCDDKIKKVDMELALGVLVMLQKLSPTPFPEITEYQAASDSTFAEFKHWVDHAMAAYGRRPPICLGSRFAGCNDDLDRIACTTGVGKADILLYEDTEAVKSRKWLEYYLAVDRAKSAVVLSIKGTSSIKAALTDLRCDYIEQDTYKYHRGIFEASEALVEHIKGDITRALDANPTFSLVTCGHSLGGGAAALVAHLLSSKMPDGRFVTKTENRDIHCYAIGPAASMCARASADCQGLISSLVHKNDIVPSLSDGVVEDIKAFAGYLQENREYLGRVYFSTGRMVAGLGGSSKAGEYLATFRSLATNEKLMPPGMVYFIGKRGRLRFGRVKDASSVEKHFGEARFVLGMLKHHALPKIRKTMGRFT